MNYKYKKILAYLVPVFLVVSFIIHITQTFNSTGVFFFDFLLTLTIIFGVIIFVKQQVFRAWLKFAIVFLLFAIIFVLITPNSTSSFADFDKKSLTLFLAGIFLISSLGIIFWEARKEKNK